MVAFLLSASFGRQSVCLGPGLVAVWSFPVLAVSGALVSSLVCCPCLPGSGSCAGFREKGRRPKNRTRRSFARAGLFQVLNSMLALLGGIVAIYSSSYQLRLNLAMGLLALSTRLHV